MLLSQASDTPGSKTTFVLLFMRIIIPLPVLIAVSFWPVLEMGWSRINCGFCSLLNFSSISGWSFPRCCNCGSPFSPLLLLSSPFHREPDPHMWRSDPFYFHNYSPPYHCSLPTSGGVEGTHRPDLIRYLLAGSLEIGWRWFASLLPASAIGWPACSSRCLQTLVGWRVVPRPLLGALAYVYVQAILAPCFIWFHLNECHSVKQTVASPHRSTHWSHLRKIRVRKSKARMRV